MRMRIMCAGGGDTSTGARLAPAVGNPTVSQKAENLEHGYCEPYRASRGGAPANLREALVGPLERVQVGGVVQIERCVREPNNPPARRGAP
jgi:hypothetical protein